jgi:biotin carboxylase
VLDPPLQLRTELLAELTDLVVRSLGDPAHYAASVDKAALARLAAAAGVPVPPGDAVDDERAAVDLAESLGYPVIVRPTVGTASSGVMRCMDASGVRRAMRELPQSVGWIPPQAKRALVQRLLTGRHANHPAVAWQGREIAGFTRVAVRQFPEGGPSSVARYAPDADTAAANARLLAALGLTGFASTEYLIDDDTGIAHLIEINRRMTPATHTGSCVGVDLASALAAVCANRMWEGPTDAPADTDLTLALFPQELLRDRASPFLTACPTDAPWEDPALLQAMLNLGS